VGVAPTSTLRRLRAEADDVVCLHDTDQFGAVGQFYDEFSEVTDDDVVAALAPHAGARRMAATPPPESPR
ncbi:MAG: phosphoribosyltransferase, partial [Vicinamibacterales bacterium]